VHLYTDHLQTLHSLIDEIYERNGEQFENKEEVFEILVKAVLIGDVLPLRRMIDATFGKGMLC